MLLEFKAQNHRSIRDEVHFSLLAGSDKSRSEQLIAFGPWRVLRSCVIYGDNDSGKSNFLSAIRYVKELVVDSFRNQPGDRLRQERHKLATLDQPASFHLQFVKDGMRFAYGFSLLEGQVVQEALHIFPNGRQTRVFERHKGAVQVGEDYRKALKVSAQALKPNRLFLSCAANLSDLALTETAFRFFKDDLMLFQTGSPDWVKNTARILQANPEVKAGLLKMLGGLGLPVKDIRIAPSGSISIVYEAFEADLLSEESDGVQSLFTLLPPIFDALHNDKVLFWDGLETGIHTLRLWQIVEFFTKRNGSGSAQLIFTAHNTTLLNQELFRRDQIWFARRNEKHATTLYSLADLRNVRRSENLEKNYLAARYGAVPELDLALLEELRKEEDASEN